MSRKPTKSYSIISIAIMSALAIIFDVIPSVRAPWGMKIDFVGTVWVLSYFLYGLSIAFPVSAITSLYLTFFSTTGFVGATMKFVATIPMFLIPALVSHLPFFSNRGSKIFNNLPLIIGLNIIANVVRLLVATVVNLYWAIPIWTGMTQDEILGYYGGLIPLIIFVAVLNVLQGFVDILVAWALAFKTKLSAMYGTW